MDSLSHSCFSYLICRGSGVAPTPKIGLVAAGVGLLPDLDFLLVPILPELSRFAFHRGPSHSLFMALVIGVLVGTLIFRWIGLSWLRTSILVSAAWLSHIFLDMCTGFGVALWWPFSHARVSFDLLFVVDPLATLPLLVAVIWDLRSNWNNPNPNRRTVMVGLFMWGAYALIAFGIRSKVEDDFVAELSHQDFQVLEIHSEPTPFNNQLWYLCAKTEEGFIYTYRSIWDGDQWERWLKLPRIQNPLKSFGYHPLLDKMRVVLDDWYTCREVDANRLQVVDMRLGQRYGWEDDDAPFLFVYQIQRAENGGLDWSMDKPKNRYDYGRLRALFDRVSGNIPEYRLRRSPVSKELAPDSTSKRQSVTE